MATYVPDMELVLYSDGQIWLRVFDAKFRATPLEVKMKERYPAMCRRARFLAKQLGMRKVRGLNTWRRLRRVDDH